MLKKAKNNNVLFLVVLRSLRHSDELYTFIQKLSAVAKRTARRPSHRSPSFSSSRARTSLWNVTSPTFTRATVPYFPTTNAGVRKPKKYSRPRCGFTFVSRGWWRQRLKAKRGCLANISKTKCKLTRRPFGVYTTARSRVVEELPRERRRETRYSNNILSNNILMRFFIFQSKIFLFIRAIFI